MYQKLIEKVGHGAKLKIDFQRRTINRKKCVFSLPLEPLECVLENIENLYENFRFSVPTKESASYGKCYFKALPVGDLSDWDMANNEKREVAKAKLELYILMSVIAGSLYWNEEIMGKWFWQSKKCPDLILLRDWIEEKENKNE